MGLPKSRVVRRKALNGEIHLILPEYKFDETRETAEDLDETEIRKIMKKKPPNRFYFYAQNEDVSPLKSQRLLTNTYGSCHF